VRVSDKHKSDIWGYAYNPTHIAGLQVFFQAILNGNTLINLFEAPREQIFNLIRSYHITNISATPTFYRLLLPITHKFETIKKLTSGGEKFDTNLSSNLLQAFPNARLRNVYASTEAGTILESRDDMFSIIDVSLCKIVEGELLIHTSMLGIGFEEAKAQSDWYATGDLVDIVETNPLRFKFLHRKNEMINVGGYKVNPLDVEQVMESNPHILQAYVYGKANPVLGNILIADIVADEPMAEKDLRAFLIPLLQPYKIPRIINFVESIALTRSGKVKRT
jgi:acyl-coenzyme A synthetase/AMP-(fatty) acid ligase